MTLIEIFKAGKRPDAHGTVVEITPADLQQVVDAYDVAERLAVRRRCAKSRA